MFDVFQPSVLARPSRQHAALNAKPSQSLSSVYLLPAPPPLLRERSMTDCLNVTLGSMALVLWPDIVPLQLVCS